MESWSRVQIFHSGDEYYQNLLADLRQAQKSITLECYIFAMDKLTEKILKELADARSRGCSVKLVVDGFGSYLWISNLSKFCHAHGLELRIFHPMPYPMMWVRRAEFLRNFKMQKFLSHMNRRNHRKITIIDENRAYLGSLNFTQVHCAEFVGKRAWRDTGARIEGPAIRQLVIAFQVTYLRTIYKGFLAWVARWRNSASPWTGAVQLNTTQKMRRELYRDLLKKLSQARGRIYITTAYFLPKRTLMKVLLKAASQGVDVRLMLPGKSDVPLVKWAAFFFLRFLAQKKIPIYEYQASILHAKTMIIDNDVFVGSFNLNHRSLLHDLEVVVHFNDAASLENMLQQWQKDVDHSKLISEKEFASSWLTRILYKIAFRLRYML